MAPANNYIEIRLHIYRQLLIPESAMHIYPQRPHYSDDISDFSSDIATNGDSDDESRVSSEIQYDSDWDSVSDLSAINFCRAYERRYPTILRVNRQIYSEASSTMYNEGTFILEASHIACLSQDQKRLIHGGLVVWPDRNPWRHNPLLGSESEKNGLITYNSETMPGVMEPHVFKRFRKFHVHPSLADKWVMINEDTKAIDHAYAIKFQASLRESSFAEDLVKLISISPEITHLSILLTLSDVRLESLSGLFSAPRVMLEVDETKVAEIYDLKEAAHQRLTDLFLETKVFAPLLELTNVKNFTPKFEFNGYPTGRPYAPRSRDVALIRGIKEEVEKNFTEPAERPHGNFEDYPHVVVPSSSLARTPSKSAIRFRDLSATGWVFLKRFLDRI